MITDISIIQPDIKSTLKAYEIIYEDKYMTAVSFKQVHPSYLIE